MATTPQDVRDVAPEFADTGAYTDAKIQVAITRALRHVSAESWSDSYDDGVAYLAAHFYALSNPAPSARPVRIYETPGAMDAGSLGRTTYGTEFVRMREELLLGVLLA